MSTTKIWLVTYPNCPVGNCKLHEPTCHHLKPSANKPLTGARMATAAELRTQEPCRVC